MGIGLKCSDSKNIVDRQQMMHCIHGTWRTSVSETSAPKIILAVATQYILSFEGTFLISCCNQEDATCISFWDTVCWWNKGCGLPRFHRWLWKIFMMLNFVFWSRWYSWWVNLNDFWGRSAFKGTVKPRFTLPRFIGSFDLPGLNSIPQKQALCVN